MVFLVMTHRRCSDESAMRLSLHRTEQAPRRYRKLCRLIEEAGPMRWQRRPDWTGLVRLGSLTFVRFAAPSQSLHRASDQRNFQEGHRRRSVGVRKTGLPAFHEIRLELVLQSLKEERLLLDSRFPRPPPELPIAETRSGTWSDSRKPK